MNSLLLRAFDLLFNKRDYAGAEKLWSPHYFQRSANVEPGREGLFNLTRSLPSSLGYEAGLIVADGTSSSYMGASSALGNGKPDRGRYSSRAGRHPCRALGCHSGRSYGGTVEE
jgi:hypothetical protein